MRQGRLEILNLFIYVWIEVFTRWVDKPPKEMGKGESKTPNRPFAHPRVITNKGRKPRVELVTVKWHRTPMEAALQQVGTEQTTCYCQGCTIMFSTGSSEKQEVLGDVGGYITNDGTLGAERGGAGGAMPECEFDGQVMRQSCLQGSRNCLTKQDQSRQSQIQNCL